MNKLTINKKVRSRTVVSCLEENGETTLKHKGTAYGVAK